MAAASTTAAAPFRSADAEFDSPQRRRGHRGRAIEPRPSRPPLCGRDACGSASIFLCASVVISYSAPSPLASAKHVAEKRSAFRRCNAFSNAPMNSGLLATSRCGRPMAAEKRSAFRPALLLHPSCRGLGGTEGAGRCLDNRRYVRNRTTNGSTAPCSPQKNVCSWSSSRIG